jgi:hypoxanthine-DNA glycosylase
MTPARSFAYVASPDARLLLLGSMPGVASLNAQRYYAHERNQFWPIMLALLGAEPSLAYPQRLALLTQHRIALWDVLAECQRRGSLDADIARDSIRCNDFAGFFAAHPAIVCIAFNGKTAQQIYQRRVLPQLAPHWQTLTQLVLPSTSPAHASVSLAEKQRHWQRVLAAVLQES